jgi:Secretion system C-terminal sorting domain
VDAKGSVYYQQTNNLETIKVNCNQWASGVYMVKVKDVNSGTVVNKKIVKQ